MIDWKLPKATATLLRRRRGASSPMGCRILLGFLIAGLPLHQGSAETFKFRIDFSDTTPHQVIQSEGGITVTEVRAETSSGSAEPVAYGSDPKIFSDQIPTGFISSGNGWQAADQASSKSYVFTIRATGPYLAADLSELRFLLHRNVSSGNSFRGISVNGIEMAQANLPPGQDIDVKENPSHGKGFRELEIRIQAWDESVDGEVYLAAISGAGTLDPVPVEAESTIHHEDRFAYSANTGWINLRPDAEHGVVVGEYFISGYAWSGNLGWIHFGRGTPSNGWRYENKSGDDFGVNLDKFGNFSGFAWGANFGWINFGWASANDPYRPRIDMRTGGFKGYAWGANIGWIDLGTLATENLALLDGDGDGMPDAWEYRHFGDLDTAGPGTDYSGDGYTDWEHYIADADPTVAGAPLAILEFGITEHAGDEVGVLRFTSSPRRLYRIDTTKDLTTWTDGYKLGFIAPDSGNATIESFLLEEEKKREFFRVRAFRPLDSP